MNWQGTYSVYFVINCAPLAFSNDAQWLVPIFLISGFLLCLLYFVQQLLHTLLKLRQANILALFVLIAFCCVQLLPSPKEAFYWASGGIMYTGFFSGMLLLLGMVLRFYTIPHKRAIWFDLSTIISFIVAGGNYPTALIQCEILFVLMMMAFFGGGYVQKQLFSLLPTFLASIAGLLINVLAPGNQIRMAANGLEHANSLFKTIDISFVISFDYAQKWLSPTLVLCLFAAIPICYDMIVHSTLKFPLPLLFTAISLAVYCSAFAPISSTWASVAGRYENVAYYTYVLFLFMNVFYYVGWITRKTEEILAWFSVKADNWNAAITATLKKCFVPAAFLFCIVIFVQSYPVIRNLPGFSSSYPYTFLQATKELLTGRAQMYHDEYLQRVAILTDSDVQDVILPTYTNAPEILYVSEITEDPSYGTNQDMARFYHKNSVRIAAIENGS